MMTLKSMAEQASTATTASCENNSRAAPTLGADTMDAFKLLSSTDRQGPGAASRLPQEAFIPPLLGKYLLCSVLSFAINDVFIVSLNFSSYRSSSFPPTHTFVHSYFCTDFAILSVMFSHFILKQQCS